MAVEIYKSPVAGSNYSTFPNEMWYLGSFFSGSTHIKIIDSYTSHWWENKPFNGAGGDPPASYVPHRYKGDPFADYEVRPASPGGGPYHVWDDVNDIGDVNCWIIIECQTTLFPGLLLPKWQCKIQWQNSSVGFADPSDPTGVKYPLSHNGGRNMFWRFAPWGGWDLLDVTPDFNPVVAAVNKSTQNRIVNVGSFGSGSDTRDYVVLDDGQLLRWNRWNTYGFGPLSLACVAGDVLPVDHNYMPMPRAFITNGGIDAEMNKVGNTEWLCYGAFYSYAGDYTINQAFGMTYWDDALARISQGFKLATIGMNLVKDGFTQPNLYDPTFEIDLFPYVPIPYLTQGAHFSIPGLRIGHGTGFHPVNGKKWVSMDDDGPSIFLKWDGVSSLWP